MIVECFLIQLHNLKKIIQGRWPFAQPAHYALEGLVPQFFVDSRCQVQIWLELITESALIRQALQPEAMVGMYMRNKNCVYIRQSQTLITQRKLIV